MMLYINFITYYIACTAYMVSKIAKPKPRTFARTISALDSSQLIYYSYDYSVHVAYGRYW